MSLNKSCPADSPNFYCNDCIKLRRPSYGLHLDANGCPVAGSDGDAESADKNEDSDGDDDEYWMRDDADQRASNAAVALDNTPQLGQCGVMGQPNRSCYDYEHHHISQRVMWQW